MESDKPFKISTLPHFPIIPPGAPVSRSILPTMALLASEIKILQAPQAIKAGIDLAGRPKHGNFSAKMAQFLVERGVIEQLPEILEGNALLRIEQSVQASKRKYKFVIE
jgi:hypothetical protein